MFIYEFTTIHGPTPTVRCTIKVQELDGTFTTRDVFERFRKAELLRDVGEDLGFFCDIIEMED